MQFIGKQSVTSNLRLNLDSIFILTFAFVRTCLFINIKQPWSKWYLVNMAVRNMWMVQFIWTSSHFTHKETSSVRTTMQRCVQIRILLNFDKFTWVYLNLHEFIWPTDWRTDGRTDRRTDKASYRDAWTHLKIWDWPVKQTQKEPLGCRIQWKGHSTGFCDTHLIWRLAIWGAQLLLCKWLFQVVNIYWSL